MASGVLVDVVPMAVGVALSPIPAIVMVLVLLAPVGVAGGAGLLVGRLFGLVLMVSVFVLLAEGLDGAFGSTAAAAALRVVLGLALVWFGISKWRARPGSDQEPELPSWMTAIDRFSVPGAVRTGFLMTVANPKEIAFCAGAGLVVGGSTLALGPALAVAGVFSVVACTTLIVPLVAIAVAGSRLDNALGSTRDWLVRNNSAGLAAVLLVIGVLLLRSGLWTLLG